MNPEKPFPKHSEVTSNSQAPSPISKRQSVPKVMAMPLAVPAEILISQSIVRDLDSAFNSQNEHK